MYLNALWREYPVAGNNYRIEIVCSYVRISWHITERRNRKWGGGVSDKGTKGARVPRDDLNKGPPSPLLLCVGIFISKF